MKAAIYIRVSTLNQAENGESLDLQKERLSSYAQSQGWEITEVYEDAGLSGGSSNRPAFQKLIGDAKQKKFDVVLVYKIDRLSRSILDFHQTMKIFQENNISFVSLTQQFNTSTSTGRLMLNILVDFANFEREINVDRAIDSFLGRFYKGLHSGQTPFGYKRENGNNLVTDPDQAEIVRQIFNSANEGVPTRKIAKQFGLGVDRVKTILDNPIYTGYLAPRKDKHGYHDHDVSKWVKGNHEGIISMELFFTVQKKYRRGQRTTKHIAIFQKLIYCPYCKHNYSFLTKENKSGRRYFYQCQRIYGNDGCYRSIEEPLVENILINEIGNLFNTKLRQPERINIDEEITKIDRKIDKIIDLDIDYLPKDKIKRKIDKLQMEKSKLLQQKKSTVKETTLHRYFKEIKDIYPYASREEKKRLWSLVVERISVYDNYIDVVWRGGMRTRHGKKAPSGNELCKVREGGVVRATQLILDKLEKVFNT